MPQWIRVARADDVPSGAGKEVAAAGRVIALFHVNDDWYAMDGICPHAGGPLADGALDGSIVTCPWHGWQFDVTTGKHCLNESLEHSTFPVKEEDGSVFVELP